MTPSLVPAGSDVWNMLDSSSMSVSLSFTAGQRGDRHVKKRYRQRDRRFRKQPRTLQEKKRKTTVQFNLLGGSHPPLLHTSFHNFLQFSNCFRHFPHSSHPSSHSQLHTFTSSSIQSIRRLGIEVPLSLLVAILFL